MRFDSHYDLVLEVDYPLGESSDLAYDTWGRGIRARVTEFFANDLMVRDPRVVRSRNHLKISVRVWGFSGLGYAIHTLVRVVGSQVADDVTIRIHEVEVEKRAVDNTMSIEEIGEMA